MRILCIPLLSNSATLRVLCVFVVASILCVTAQVLDGNILNVKLVNLHLLYMTFQMNQLKLFD